MTRVILFRHAEPLKTREVAHTNWPLSQIGRKQTDHILDRIAGYAPLNVISGPALRCRQTAEMIADRLRTKVKIEPRVGELTPPKGTQDVYAWLLQNFNFQPVRHWNELDAALNKWRDDNIKAISEIKEDSIVVTHFANINAITGAALRLDVTMSCRPQYASLTEFNIVNGDIRLVWEGTEIKGPNE